MTTVGETSPSRTKAVNRERILMAAPEVLRRTGLTAFSLEEVARAAGVARQTIYNHFDGRDDLMAALLVQEMADRHAPLQTEMGSRTPSTDNLTALLLAELEAGWQYGLYDDMLSPSNAPRMVELVFRSDVVAMARENAWVPILTQYVEAGLMRPGLDLREVTRWITYQQFWFLTHPGTIAGIGPGSLEHVIRTYVVPSLLVDEA